MNGGSHIDKRMLQKRKLATCHSPLTTSAGFTLIELLIVIAISVFLTSLVITFSGVGQNQTTLATETVAIAEVIARAKSLSLSAYTDSTGQARSCAYGVFFNPSTESFSIVIYHRPAGAMFCPSPTTLQTTGASAGDLSVYASQDASVILPPGVKFSPSSSGGKLSLVIFYPPNPTVLLSESLCPVGSAGCTFTFVNQSESVSLSTVDGSASRSVTVGTLGGISW